MTDQEFTEYLNRKCMECGHEYVKHEKNTNACPYVDPNNSSKVIWYSDLIHFIEPEKDNG